MRPLVKYHIIHRHKEEYPVSVMCRFFSVSRSGYYSYEGLPVLVQRGAHQRPEAAIFELDDGGLHAVVAPAHTLVGGLDFKEGRLDGVFGFQIGRAHV